MHMLVTVSRSYLPASPTAQDAPDAPAAEPQPGPGSVKSAHRTVAVLEALAKSGHGRTLAELQRELRIPKSSLYNLLRTLSDSGWVELCPPGNSYRVGLRSLHLASSYFEHDPLVQAAGEPITQLRDELDETVHLARLDGSDVVYLASKESPHHMRRVSIVGRRLPAHAPALGKALLSTRSDSEIERMFPHKLEQLTSRTVANVRDLQAELEVIRERGYALEDGQTMTGLICFAVVVPGHFPGTDALSCSLPKARVDDAHTNRIVSGLMQCANQLGHLVRSNGW